MSRIINARTEALAGVAISIVLAVLPVVANFDWASTAGAIAGILAVLKIVDQRLQGWQNWDTAQSNERQATIAALGDGSVKGRSQGLKPETHVPAGE